MRNALLAPSAQHLLGTDPVGRDTLSRIIYGSRVALMVGLVATGVRPVRYYIGIIAGYFAACLHHYHAVDTPKPSPSSCCLWSSRFCSARTCCYGRWYRHVRYLCE
jgi:hypothetical protein